MVADYRWLTLYGLQRKSACDITKPTAAWYSYTVDFCPFEHCVSRECSRTTSLLTNGIRNTHNINVQTDKNLSHFISWRFLPIRAARLLFYHF